MSNINSRLDAFINYLGMSKNQFASSLGTSSAMISKITKNKVNFGVDILEKIITKYSHLNQLWLLTGIGDMVSDNHTNNTHPDTHLVEKLQTKRSGKVKEKEDAEVLFLGDYTENRIAFYYRHPLRRVEALLSVTLDEFKTTFNDYLQLIKVTEKLEAPDFLLAKHRISTDFKKYRKELDEEIAEEHRHITDQKLLKCVQITNYAEITEHFSKAISNLIHDISDNIEFFGKSSTH